MLTYPSTPVRTPRPSYKALPYDFSISFENLLAITGLANFIAGVNNPLSGDLPSAHVQVIEDSPLLGSKDDIFQNLISL
jgi:hypothetical protein